VKHKPKAFAPNSIKCCCARNLSKIMIAQKLTKITKNYKIGENAFILR